MQTVMSIVFLIFSPVEKLLLILIYCPHFRSNNMKGSNSSVALQQVSYCTVYTVQSKLTVIVIETVVCATLNWRIQ